MPWTKRQQERFPLPRPRPVEELAEYLHRKTNESVFDGRAKGWADLPGEARERYLKVAAAVLADPPEALRGLAAPQPSTAENFPSPLDDGVPF